MKTDDQQPKNYPPSTEQPQDKVKEEAVAYATPPCQYAITELEQRLRKMEENGGHWLTGEEMRKRIQQKYPFLCE